MARPNRLGERGHTMNEMYEYRCKHPDYPTWGEKKMKKKKIKKVHETMALVLIWLWTAMCLAIGYLIGYFVR